MESTQQLKKTDGLLWSCPQCGKLIRFPNKNAVRLAERAGLCKGCRAERTLRKRPGLIWVFCDFSKRTGTKYSFLE